MVSHNRNEILQVSDNRGRNIDINEKRCYDIDMERIRLFSVEEVSRALGVSRSGVYNLINSRELKAIKLESRTMIKMSDLVAFVDSRERYTGCLNEI